LGIVGFGSLGHFNRFRSEVVADQQADQQPAVQTRIFAAKCTAITPLCHKNNEARLERLNAGPPGSMVGLRPAPPRSRAQERVVSMRRKQGIAPRGADSTLMLTHPRGREQVTCQPMP
jgi:hypothetical protein